MASSKSSVRGAHGVATPSYRGPSREQAWLTDADHATWRLLIARTHTLLEAYAERIHPAYLDGFKLLFSDCARIPSVDDLNRKLRRFDWQAVIVDGYLPHEEYARLLVARTFPVARYIRKSADVDHSPVPDLAHDMIGHLPMLSDPRHCEFLQRMGAEMSCAQSDERDYRLYLAQQRAGQVRQLAIHSAEQVSAADADVARVEAELAFRPSGVARLSRLYLWTIEFGLLGDVDDWMAYGAALLSSGRELRQLMSGEARIEPLSVEAIDAGISFCELQRRYFLAKDHAAVQLVLDRVLSSSERCETPSSRQSYVVTRPRA